MKKAFSLILTLLLFSLISCNKDNPVSTGTGGGLIGGTGGGTGNVTFTVAVVQDNQQQLYFEFKPSTGATLDQIRVQCPAIQVDETIADNSGDVYTANEPLYIGPVQGLQTGQQWTFNLKGKIGSTTGQAYDVTVNFTVP